MASPAPFPGRLESGPAHDAGALVTAVYSAAAAARKKRSPPKRVSKRERQQRAEAVAVAKTRKLLASWQADLVGERRYEPDDAFVTAVLCPEIPSVEASIPLLFDEGASSDEGGDSPRSATRRAVSALMAEHYEEPGDAAVDAEPSVEAAALFSASLNPNRRRRASVVEPRPASSADPAADPLLRSLSRGSLAGTPFSEPPSTAAAPSTRGASRRSVSRGSDRRASTAGQEKGDFTSLQHEWSREESVHALSSPRAMIARPRLSQNEWKPIEIQASKVGNFSPFSCPGPSPAFETRGRRPTSSRSSTRTGRRTARGHG